MDDDHRHDPAGGDDLQVVREVELPVGADEAWDAITDAARVSAWFGAEVTWDLRPGGSARFRHHDGTERRGRVDEVVPAQRLRFRWWPAGADDGPTGTDGDGDGDGDRAGSGHGTGTGGPASTVSYELHPVPAGTRLVVTETLPAPAAPAAPSASLSVVAAGGVTPWAVRLVGLWLGCHRRLPVPA